MFEYIPRIAKSLAHTLATKLLKKKEEIYLLGNVPETKKNMIECKNQTRNGRSRRGRKESLERVDQWFRIARMHEKASRTGKEIASFVNSYITELNGVEKRTPKISQEVRKWKHPPGQSVKVNFDGAYDERLCQSASWIVVRNCEGDVLLSSSKIHQEVTSAFAADALASLKAAQIGIDMKWSEIIIESTESLKKKEEIYLLGSIPEYAENQKEYDRVREPD
ncbi:hypothetical protein Gotur_034872 [Gossypium turneri]